MFRKLLFSSMLLLPLHCFADPVISKLQITGDYIEVWGTGFGDKPNVKPLAWLDYESDNDPSLYRLDMKALTANGSVAKDPKNPANNVFYYDLKGHASGGPESIPFSSDNLYVSMNRYYDFNLNQPELLLSSSGGGLNLKPFRLWTEWSSAVKAHDILFGYQGKEGLDSGRITPELTEEFSQWTGTTVSFRGFLWFNQEYLYNSSDLDVRNGLLQMFTDGQKAASRAMTTITTAYPVKYKFLFFDQVSNYGLPNPLGVYYDDIYIDDSFSRIVITDGDSATNNIQTQTLPLIPVIWQSTYIKAKLTHAAKDKKQFYLYVYDSKNVGNSRGLKYCPLCPKPPQAM